MAVTRTLSWDAWPMWLRRKAQSDPQITSTRRMLGTMMPKPLLMKFISHGQRGNRPLSQVRVCGQVTRYNNLQHMLSHILFGVARINFLDGKFDVKRNLISHQNSLNRPSQPCVRRLEVTSTHGTITACTFMHTHTHMGNSDLFAFQS